MSPSIAEMEAAQNEALDRGDLRAADQWEAQLEHAEASGGEMDDGEMER